MWLGAQTRHPVESQVDEVGGDQFLGRIAILHPPQSGHAHHPGEGLGVDAGIGGVQPMVDEPIDDEPLHPGGDVGEDRRI